MELPELSLNDLSVYYDKEELIRQTAEQIDKDFQFHGEEVNFSGSPEQAYSELKYQITAIVERLLRVNAQNLVNILYRIDLTEHQIRESFETADEGGTPAALAHHIIDRELKKVLIRNYFSSRQ